MTTCPRVRFRTRATVLCLLTFLVSTGLHASGAGAATITTRRADVSSKGAESPDGGIYHSISGSGRFVAFESNSTDLVKGDTNAETDVFVRDRREGTTERVSLRSNGAQGNSWSGYSAISANGRFVAFTAEASNLVKGDGNGVQDVFIHDRVTGKTTRVSVGPGGREGNDDSAYPTISADGRFVAFSSDATNLVKGDSNGYGDFFVHDRQTGTTALISVSSSGEQANAGSSYLDAGMISADGRLIVFSSTATNLVAGDTNAVADVFVHDRVSGKTRRLSVDSSGNQGNGESGDPSISANGRFVAFDSSAMNLVGGDTNGYADIFVRDLATSTTKRISLDRTGGEADADSADPSISANGRLVAFDSSATDLVGGDTNAVTDVFVRDRKLKRTRRMSVSTAGAEGDSSSRVPFLSANGAFVAFESEATNLVGGDSNARTDIFVRGPLR